MSWITTAGLISSSLNVTLAQGGMQLLQRSNVTFDFTGKHLLGVTNEGYAAVWDAHSGKLLRKFEGHAERVRSVQLCQNRKIALTSSFISPGETNIPSKDNSIRLWDISTGKQLLYIPDATFGQFSRDGKRIFGLIKRSRGRLFDLASWDVKSGKRLFTSTLPGEGADPESHFTLQESSQSSKLLFFQSYRARVYDCSSGKPLTDTISFRNGGDGFGFISPKGDEVQLAVNQYTSFYSLSKRTELKRIPHPQDNSGFGKMAWNLDGDMFARAGWTGTIMSYRREKGLLVSGSDCSQLTDSVLMSPNGKHFIVYFSGNPRKSIGFSSSTCEAVWTKPGHAIGFLNSEDVVHVNGAKLSIIKMSTGKERLLCTLDDAPTW